MERSALRSHFGIKASKIGINGNCVQISAIARNLATDLMRFSPNSKVVIVFDRETRRETSKELADELIAVLSKEFPSMSFCIGVPDRDIESWIFSDKESTSKHFKKKIGKKAAFEGEVGAQAIKKRIGPGRYDKMTDGVALLGKISWARVQKRSPSAKNFSASTHFPGCPWLSS